MITATMTAMLTLVSLLVLFSFLILSSSPLLLPVRFILVVLLFTF